MRITISGTHSVGKTTLLNRLKEVDELKSFEFNSENMRELNKKGVKVNLEADDDSAYVIADSNFKLAERDNYISDRYVLDGFIYARYHNIHDKVSDEVIKYYYSRINDIRAASDIVFFIQPEFDIVDDNFRSTDIKFQKDIDILFKEYLEKFNIKHYILTGSIDNRINQFLDVYKGYK